MMKLTTFLPIAVCLVLAVSCEPEKFGPLINTSDAGNIGALTGSWKVSSVKQTDDEATIKNSPYVSRIITNEFPFTEFQLTLESQAGVPGNFATNPGNAPRIIPFASGNWIVDNREAPREIAFVNGNDTVKAQVGAYPSSFKPSFILRIPRVNAETGKTTMVYEYQFTKQ